MEEQKSRRLPEHIMVLRGSAMGDVAMLAHAVRALKEAYPALRVTVATRELFVPFFDGIDVEFMFLDKVHRGGLREMVAFVREARRRGVQAVADTHFVIRSVAMSALFMLSGIGSAHIRKGKVEKWFRMGYSRPDAVPLKHTVVRYCDVFRRLGFELDDPQPVSVKPPLANPMGEKPAAAKWVGFAPFSAHEGKTYPAGAREEVVRLLSERCDKVFIHSGGGAEQEFALAMAAQYPNVEPVFGRWNLRCEIALISHLDCVVSMDSLVMHICSLTATPVVSVWGATHPELGFFGYGCDPGLALQEEMPCRPCSTYGKKPCKFGDVRCLRAISPQEIADKVSEVLGVPSQE